MKIRDLTASIVFLLLSLFLCSCVNSNTLLPVDTNMLVSSNDTGNPNSKTESDYISSVEPHDDDISSTPVLSFDSLIMYVKTGDEKYYKPHRLSKEEENALTDNLESDGYRAVFLDDGTIKVFQSMHGLVLVIYPDGSAQGLDIKSNKQYSFINHDYSLSSSVFVDVIPVPDFKIRMMESFNDDCLFVSFNRFDYEKASAYAETLKSSGFKYNISEKANIAYPIYPETPLYAQYSFSGRNEDGIWVEFKYQTQTDTFLCTLSIGTIPEEVVFNYDPWEYEKGNTTIDHYKEAYDWLLSGEENFDVSENDYYVILSKYGCILKDAQSYALKCEKNGFIPTRFRETPGTDENDTGEYYYWNPYNGKYIRINYCKDESGNNLLQICLMKVALNTPPSESE